MYLQNRMERCQLSLPTILKRYLPQAEVSPLYAAMHYACLNGGKRLRPLLVYSTGEMFGVPWERLDPIAAAIEFIHCYSLVHDDLPAMDDDDLRRGKPTCHKAFGEATAILAGDALLTLAFDLLANHQHFSSQNESEILKIIRIFCQAAGANGMIRGQALDLEAQGNTLSLEQLTQMHHAKTGALIAASVQCGALASGTATNNDLHELQKFGEAIGLGFQIQDDILDSLGNKETMGKLPGQDVKRNKCTFVTLLGLDRAHEHAQHCHQVALSCLTRFGAKADPLRAISHYIIQRMT